MKHFSSMTLPIFLKRIHQSQLNAVLVSLVRHICAPVPQELSFVTLSAYTTQMAMNLSDTVLLIAELPNSLQSPCLLSCYLCTLEQNGLLVGIQRDYILLAATGNASCHYGNQFFFF